MSISLTINADHPHDLKQQLADILAGQAQTATAPAPKVETVPIQPGGTLVPTADGSLVPTATPVKRTRKPAQTGGGMPDEKQSDVDALETAPTIKDVTDVLLKFVNDHEDEETPPKILAEFGAKKISELKPADYKKVIEKADELLGEKKAATK